MINQKIEDAFAKKNITKLFLVDFNEPVYGIFTGRISTSNPEVVPILYKYYFKEIDMLILAENKDVYKATKRELTIVQDQIADIEETVNLDFGTKL